MDIHKNARLTPLGREHMVNMVLSGQTPKAVSEAVGVCPRTVKKWVDRFNAEGLVGLQDRSSRPDLHPGRPDVLPGRAASGRGSRLDLREAVDALARLQAGHAAAPLGGGDQQEGRRADRLLASRYSGVRPTESHRGWDASDADGTRASRPNPRIPPHPPGGAAKNTHLPSDWCRRGARFKKKLSSIGG